MGATVGPLRARRTRARALAAGEVWIWRAPPRLLGPCSSMPGPPCIAPLDGVRGVGDPARPRIKWATGGDGRARACFHLRRRGPERAPAWLAPLHPSQARARGEILQRAGLADGLSDIRGLAAICISTVAAQAHFHGPFLGVGSGTIKAKASYHLPTFICPQRCRWWARRSLASMHKVPRGP
ncbi:hypothetical protein T492DRAFT_1095233 [Pavlovales sp. CCMP2436]|nr:hypothetical protein T492DRAFT_1095233 [Pavlovales sp. CCMP2436]